MAIIKLTAKNKDTGKGGNAMLFFADDGTGYIASLGAVKKLINGEWSGGFILLSRLPIPIDKNRFKQSPVFDKVGNIAPREKEDDMNYDGLGSQRMKTQKEIEQYKDKQVW